MRAPLGGGTRVRCWRCGCEQAWVLAPWALCGPCQVVVTPEEIRWMDDDQREPDAASWMMTPLGRPCGAP